MKKKKSCCFVALLFLFLALFAFPASAQAASQAKLSSSKVTIAIGNKKQLKMKNTKAKVKWTSSKPSVASVSKGLVTAKKKGFAKITAKVNNKNYTCKVTVVDAKLNATSLNLNIGDTKQLKFTNSKGSVLWSSNKTSVAKVSKKGVVTAVGIGNAKISAKIGSKTYKCNVTTQNRDSEAYDISLKTEDGGAFIEGLSTAKISFKLTNPSTNVVAKIVSSSNEVCYQTSFASIKAHKATSFKWNGKTNDGDAASGTYQVVITAGRTNTASTDMLSVKKQEFAGGTGAAANPFLVNTWNQFKAIEHFNDYCFKQNADISANFTTVAGFFSEDTPFTGTYDGGGYRLCDLFISDTNSAYVSLIRSIGAEGTIKNMDFSNIRVNGTERSALLTRSNYGMISKCSFTDCSVAASVSGKDSWVGLIADANQNGATITGCTITDCTISNTYGWQHGWIAPLAAVNDGNIMDCIVTGSTVNTKSTSFGWAHGSGLVALNNANMINCQATDATLISASENCSWSGGICAQNKGFIQASSFSGTSSDSEGIFFNDGTYNP